jgi:hypothetical protein
MYAYVVDVVGGVRTTAGDWEKLSDEFAVIVKYASGTSVPPMLFGLRAALETGCVPDGGVAVSVAVAEPGAEEIGICSVAVIPPVIVPKVTVVGALADAVNVSVDEAGTPPTGVGVGPGGTEPPPPPPPPQAASASATEKSKGRPRRRWVMRIAFVS